jgi:ferritin-like metal-binding protein YciE
MTSIGIKLDQCHLKQGISKCRFAEKTTMHQTNSLHQLLDDEISRFIGAEELLQRTLPIWIQQARSAKLKTILINYHEQVKKHIVRLNTFLKEEAITGYPVLHLIMNAFVKDTEDKMKNCTDFNVRDACLLASVQNINHYKIGTYGTSASFAHTLGKERIAVLFYECEANEKKIDRELTILAEKEINNLALYHLSHA